MRLTFPFALTAAAALMFGQPAFATKPLLDCEAGTVDQVLCENTELMALHQRAITTINRVLVKADELELTAPEKEQIVGDHSGWLASRQNCLDVIDTTPKECLMQMYTTRVAELEAQWWLVPPTHSPETYTCGSETVKVTYFQTDHPVVTVEYEELRSVFKAVPAASGRKYEGPFGQYWWTKGSERMFLKDIDKDPLQCTGAEGNRPL